jgi:glycosyl transferase, family 25
MFKTLKRYKKPVLTLFLIFVSYFIFMKALYFIYPIGYHFYPELKTQKASKTLKPISGVQTYLINLDRSKKRLAYMRPKIKALGYPFERIRAIDGQSLSTQFIQKNTDTFARTHWNLFSYEPNQASFLRRGDMGCALSHIKAWKRFLKSNAQYALIFEDDVTFNPKTLHSVLEQLKAHSTEWDIVSFDAQTLNAFYPAWARTLLKPLPLFELKPPYRVVVYLKQIVLSSAYLINRQAAQNLVQLALPLKQSLDHFFTRSWELKTRFIGIEPRLVHQNTHRFMSERQHINSTIRLKVQGSVAYAHPTKTPSLRKATLKQKTLTAFFSAPQAAFWHVIDRQKSHFNQRKAAVTQAYKPLSSCIFFKKDKCFFTSSKFKQQAFSEQTQLMFFYHNLKFYLTAKLSQYLHHPQHKV